MSEPVEAHETLARPSAETARPVALAPVRRLPVRWGMPPASKGTRAAWAGGWGVLSDRRSRLSKLAERIERDMRREYSTARPLYRAALRSAARFAALGQAMLHDVGVDPKATPQRALKLTNASARFLRDVPKRAPRKREADLATALARTRPGA